MALLPLGEPKIGTENDLATLALRRLLRELEKALIFLLDFAGNSTGFLDIHQFYLH